MNDLENSGCRKTEECIREGDEDSKCNCLIDEEDRVVDGDGQKACDCAIGTFFEDQCVLSCESSDDCNGEKCVKLPQNNFKTCFCSISKMGFVYLTSLAKSI